MSKQTPGSWKLEKCDCGHAGCTSWLAGPVLHAEAVLSEADARLIAAAPEMLQVLRLIKAKYEMSRGDFSIRDLNDPEMVQAMACFIENLDYVTGHIAYALAKAEGA